MTRLEPRIHQLVALAALHRTFATHDRAQLVMACGTGKTLIGWWCAEQMTTDLTLVVVPSLSPGGSSSSSRCSGSSSRCSGWGSGPARSPGQSAAVMDIELTTRRQRNSVRTVGHWCAAQRIAYRRGELAPSRQLLCERIPGWAWQVVTATDAAAVEDTGRPVPARLTRGARNSGIWSVRWRRYLLGPVGCFRPGGQPTPLRDACCQLQQHPVGQRCRDVHWLVIVRCDLHDVGPDHVQLPAEATHGL